MMSLRRSFIGGVAVLATLLSPAVFAQEVTLTSSTTESLASAPGCPAWWFLRSPQQVVEDHIAALGTGDLDLIMCDYADDAVVVMPGSVLTGKDQIRAGLAQFIGLFGGATPEITSLTAGGAAVLGTWRLETPNVLVENSADTFIVRFGKIRYQTVFANIQFR